MQFNGKVTYLEGSLNNINYLSRFKSYNLNEEVMFESVNENKGIMRLPAIQVIFKSEPVLDDSLSDDLNLKYKNPVKLPFVKLNKMKLSEQRKKSAKNMWFHYNSQSFTP